MIEKNALGVKADGPSEIALPERQGHPNGTEMLSPTRAWQSLCARTGGSIARVTFYRWLRTGRVYSIRLGQRIFIPQAALDHIIKQCLDGERF